MNSNHDDRTNASENSSSKPDNLNQPLDLETFPLDNHRPRLSLITPTRILLGTVTSGLLGFALGTMQGGQTAQLRFRAEHAHKMPDTTTGWYLYHKTKNYHAMKGGITEGFRMAGKTSLWTFVALGLESTVDRCRGASDMFSTAIATLSVAGAFSLWRKHFSASKVYSYILQHVILPGFHKILHLPCSL